MDWRIKAGLQKILSLTRVGDKINHFGSRLMDPRYLEHKLDYHVAESLALMARLEAIGYRMADNDIFFELRTGYSIMQSLAIILLGVSRVVTVDISRDIKFSDCLKYIELLSGSRVSRLAEHSVYSETEIRSILGKLKASSDLDDFLHTANIVYVAPYHLADLERFSGRMRVVYSQVVLEHIPENRVREIMAATKCLLLPGGYQSHIVNLADHFRNPGFFQDRKITDVNFLRYSDRYWNFWCGNDIAYVNRLRFPYYMQLFRDLGFSILHVDKQKEQNRMNELLSYEEIHPDVQSKYNKSELMSTLWVQRFHIICTRQDELS